MVEQEKHGFFATALTAIGGALFGLSIAAAVVVLFATFFLNYHLISVKTGSMEPAIDKGDFVVVRPVRIDKIKEGDVILFNQVDTGAPFVHRVVATREQRLNVVDGEGKLLEQDREFFFTTKGDANTSKDGGEVSADEYLGRVWFDIPTYGIVAAGLSPTWFLIGLVFFFGILWATWEFLNRRGGGSGARRSRGKARKAGRPVPTPAGRLEARSRPSPVRRVLTGASDCFIDAADAILYGAQLAWHRIRSPFVSNNQPQVRRPYRGLIGAGSGLWILVPAAVWVAAIGVMLGASAFAAPGTPGAWEKEQRIGGEFRVVGITPTPTRTPYGYVAPTASPSPSPSPGQQDAPAPPPSNSSCNDPVSTPRPFTSSDILNRSGGRGPAPEPTCEPTPVTTAPPSATPSPAATEVPAATEEPTATEQPTATDEPTATEQPTVTEEPTATEQPTATEEPTATEVPTQSGGQDDID